MIVAGGGTGGHLFPGLAVAESLRRPDDAVLFIGSAFGIEARVIPPTAFPFRPLAIRGVRGRGVRGVLQLGWQFPSAIIRAWRMIGEFRAHVVLGVGGYASFPVVVFSGCGTDPVVRLYHVDRLGSTQVVTDWNGAIYRQMRYFAYGEDTELGIRARKAGFSCHYIPKAVVFHKYSATGGAYTPNKIYLVERNRIWTLLKLFPWYLVAVSPVLTLARYFLGLYGLLAGKGATGKLREDHSPLKIFQALFRAYRDALAEAPEMLRARRRLRSVCTMPDREFRKMIARFSADIREVSFNE